MNRRCRTWASARTPRRLPNCAPCPGPSRRASPERYVVPPSELQQGFILNLAPGTYGIRLRNPDGTIMEGTEKTLAVHRRLHRRGQDSRSSPATSGRDPWNPERLPP